MRYWLGLAIQPAKRAGGWFPPTHLSRQTGAQLPRPPTYYHIIGTQSCRAWIQSQAPRVARIKSLHHLDPVSKAGVPVLWEEKGVNLQASPCLVAEAWPCLLKGCQPKKGRWQKGPTETCCCETVAGCLSSEMQALGLEALVWLLHIPLDILWLLQTSRGSLDSNAPTGEIIPWAFNILLGSSGPSSQWKVAYERQRSSSPL